jgi:hypothetical protein
MAVFSDRHLWLWWPSVIGSFRGTAIESYRRPLHLPPRGPSNSFKFLHLPASSARRINATHPITLTHQHFLRVNPLDATLMASPASVANKRLTAELNPLDATLPKNRGWGPRPCTHFPSPSCLFPLPLDRNVSIKDPSPAGRNPFRQPHKSPVTSHQSWLTSPVHNRTVDFTLRHVYCPRAILPSLRPGDRPFLLRRRPP